MRSGSSLRIQDDTNKNDALHPIALTAPLCANRCHLRSKPEIRRQHGQPPESMLAKMPTCESSQMILSVKLLTQ